MLKASVPFQANYALPFPEERKGIGTNPSLLQSIGKEERQPLKGKERHVALSKKQSEKSNIAKNEEIFFLGIFEFFR